MLFRSHLSHMLMASYETSAFAVAGISAYFILKKQNVVFYRRSLSLALIMAAVCAPFQVLLGDLKGMNVAEFQPAKLAAVEAHWETNTDGGADFVLFGIPDMEAEKNHYEIVIPNLLSWIITHSEDGRIQGLKEFPPSERPNSPMTFFSFRIMAGIGFIFLFVMLWAGYLWWRKRLYDSPAFLKALIAIQPLGFIATVSGWVTAEVGRQPWVVYGLMRTDEGVSPIAAGNVLWSLIMFMLFFAVIGTGYFFYTIRTLRRGPDLESPIPPVQRLAGMRSLTSEPKME